MRDSLRRQLRIERLEELRRYGRGRAESLGIGPDDFEALVDQSRSARG